MVLGAHISPVEDICLRCHVFVLVLPGIFRYPNAGDAGELELTDSSLVQIIAQDGLVIANELIRLNMPITDGIAVCRIISVEHHLLFAFYGLGQILFKADLLADTPQILFPDKDLVFIHLFAFLTITLVGNSIEVNNAVARRHHIDNDHILVFCGFNMDALIDKEGNILIASIENTMNFALHIAAI